MSCWISSGIKAEHRQVADVELDDLVALFLHLLGRVHDGAADVVADVGELGGFVNGFHARSALLQQPSLRQPTQPSHEIPARTLRRTDHHAYGPGWIGINGEKIATSIILGSRGLRMAWPARFETLRPITSPSWPTGCGTGHLRQRRTRCAFRGRPGCSP
jgi:hypothetical protein